MLAGFFSVERFHTNRIGNHLQTFPNIHIYWTYQQYIISVIKNCIFVDIDLCPNGIRKALADLHARNRYGCNAAQWAALSGSVEMCRYLQAEGAEWRTRHGYLDIYIYNDGDAMQFVYMLYMICGSSFYIICSFSHPSIQFRDVITMLWSLWSPLQSRPWFGHFEQQWPQCIAQGCSERKPPSLWVARLPSPFPIFVLFNSLTSSFWPSFIEFSQSVGGFETFGDVSSSFFGHHFEAFGPRRLGRAPGGETLKSKKTSLLKTMLK